jgi:CRP-like cAMP-binding protein
MTGLRCSATIYPAKARQFSAAAVTSLQYPGLFWHLVQCVHVTPCIANFLCLSLETVNQQLTRFVEKSFISVKRRDIHINSLESLKAIV